jgi:biopolymer transport protein ExbD
MRLKMDNRLLTSFSVSSLTDIVMLLLIFFLLSSSFVTQPGIKVQLPKAETGETPDDRQLAVTLTRKGQVFLDAENVSLETLGQKLAAALKKDRDRVVVIRADKSVTLQSTVQVIDIAKAVGATRFMIATSPVIE